MSARADRNAASWAATYGPAAAAIILAATVARLLFLVVNPLNLYPDEAQYWFWAQDFEFGYFSKPPLIAWIIAAATSLCGDGEACVRAPAPLLHGLTAGFVYLLGRDLYGPRAGFWAAVSYVALPAVFVSSAIISTDVPLLTLWAAALLSLHRAAERESAFWSFAAGAAIGAGLLAKYAMLYVVPGLIILLALDETMRRFLFSKNAALMLLTALAIAEPNIVWNAMNGFETVGHTASNAAWGGDLFNVDELLDFLIGQIGVFGPLMLGALLWGLVTLRARRREGGAAWTADRYLLAFALPVLILMTAQALISRANANWAALAYVPAVVLVSGWLLRAGRGRWLAASLALHVALGTLALAAVISPPVLRALDSLTTKAQVSNGLKRLKGWDEIGAIIRAYAATGGYAAILSTDREDIAEFLYYARGTSTPILIWNPNETPHNHFEAVVPFAGAEGRVLLVTRMSDPERVTARFAVATRIARLETDIGAGRTRDFQIFELSGYRAE